MVYSLAFTPCENLFVTTKDRNTCESLGNRDEVACNAYSRCDLGGIVDPFSATKSLLRIAELEEGPGD